METLGFPAGWGVEFVVDGDTAGAIQDYTPPFELLETGMSLSEHTVEAFPIDAGGSRAAVSTDIRFGVGDYYVAFGDPWVEGSYGDDVPADDASSDLRNTSFGFTPILNDRLTTALGYPHTVENEGVTGSSFDSLDGVSLIPSVLAAHPNAQSVLILFGANDALWAGTSSGVGLASSDPNYPGSYKDNLSQILDAVVAAGKEPLLAKAPMCLGDYSGTPFPDPATAPLNRSSTS
jgi:lysophospholipase L1-like esterase